VSNKPTFSRSQDRGFDSVSSFKQRLEMKPTLSFEFFPAKDNLGETKLWKAFDELMEVTPDFVSVTYGAGGSSQDRSIAVVDKMAKQVDTVGHLTCVGSTRESIKNILRRFEDSGVKSILALRGDPARGEPAPRGDYETALDLVAETLKQTNLAVGVAAFPEKHPESLSLQQDAEVLKLKQNAGASFAITQLFFSFEAYIDLVSRAREYGVDFPIIPGIMPISNAKQVLKMAELSNARIPKELLNDLESSSDEVASRIGMQFSIDLAKRVLDSGAPGLHVYSLNQSAAALELSREVGLAI
jgi:methylenetetrahydrofolate reductase (NADPH)